MASTEAELTLQQELINYGYSKALVTEWVPKLNKFLDAAYSEQFNSDPSKGYFYLSQMFSRIKEDAEKYTTLVKETANGKR